MAGRAGRVVRVAGWVAGLTGVLLAIVVTRAVTTARAELRHGDAALATGDVPAAIDAFERAARMRVPGARAYRHGLDRLEALAARGGWAGGGGAARAALEAARRAILVTRSLGTPEAERKQRIDARLAGLLARADSGPESVAVKQAWHAARLAADDAPRPGPSVILLLGFGLWIGGGAALALGGVKSDDRLRRWQALAAAAAILVGLVLWVVGLRLA